LASASFELHTLVAEALGSALVVFSHIARSSALIIVERKTSSSIDHVASSV
jgi:hypothetical protein